MDILINIILVGVGLTSAFLMWCIMYALIGASVR